MIDQEVKQFEGGFQREYDVPSTLTSTTKDVGKVTWSRNNNFEMPEDAIDIGYEILGKEGQFNANSGTINFDEDSLVDAIDTAIPNLASMQSLDKFEAIEQFMDKMLELFQVETVVPSSSQLHIKLTEMHEVNLSITYGEFEIANSSKEGGTVLWRGLDSELSIDFQFSKFHNEGFPVNVVNINEKQLSNVIAKAIVGIESVSKEERQKAIEEFILPLYRLLNDSDVHYPSAGALAANSWEHYLVADEGEFAIEEQTSEDSGSINWTGAMDGSVSITYNVRLDGPKDSPFRPKVVEVGGAALKTAIKLGIPNIVSLSQAQRELAIGQFVRPLINTFDADQMSPSTRDLAIENWKKDFN